MNSLPTIFASVFVTLLLVAAALFSAGCVASPQKALRMLPDGKYTEAHLTVTGKFSSTVIECDACEIKDGQLEAGEMHIRHSNVYVPLIELKIKK